LGVEALVAMSNKLLMHYGCDTATGRFMRASHSLFLLELGISTQPLQESYEKYSFLSTHSWMKMLWEKISMFGIRTIIADGGLDNPRVGDRFLMQVFIEKGYSSETLLRLNRAHVYWQALFVSDILTASGNKIDPEVLGQPNAHRKRSHLRWPTEHPTASDFQCGGTGLWQFAQVGMLGRDWACSPHQHIGYGNGDGTRPPDACADPVPTAKRRMFSWQDGSRTDSIIRRHGHPPEVATSARWNLRMQRRYKEGGD
jgi:hypothetical protein